MLTYKNNDPYIEGTSLYDLVKVCQTPFYVYSQQKINNQVNNPAQYGQIKKSIARLYTTIKNTK